jgi:hypothetical protein
MTRHTNRGAIHNQQNPEESELGESSPIMG